MKKTRNLSEEILASVTALRAHRDGKITLRTYQYSDKPLPAVTPALIRATREQLHMSQGVFAKLLRISPRTLERWEQGVSKPNQQALVLILLVQKFPETLDRIGQL